MTMATSDKVKEQRAAMAATKVDKVAELDKVRADLEAARDKLGEAALNGKDVAKLRDKVADLAAREAELAAGLRVADFRLLELDRELDEAECRELARVLVDTDKRLMDEAERMLVDLYDLVERAKRCANDYHAVVQAARSKNGAKLDVPTLEMYQAKQFFSDVFNHGVLALRNAEVNFSLGGRPHRFGKVIQARRWSHRSP